MAYRHLENIDEKIIESVIKIGANEGLQKVTAKRIANDIGVSDFLIFNHFGTKQNLVNVIEKYITDYYVEAINKFMLAPHTSGDIGYQIIETLMKKKDYLLFYRNICKSHGDIKGAVANKAVYVRAVRTMTDKIGKKVSDDEAFLYWIFASANTFDFCAMLINGEMEDTPELRKSFVEITFTYLKNDLNK